jgi:hypothetical protein
MWDASIEDVHSHVEHANRLGRNVALIDVEYGGQTMVVSIVYESPEASTEELTAAFLREWAGEGRDS